MGSSNFEEEDVDRRTSEPKLSAHELLGKPTPISLSNNTVDVSNFAQEGEDEFSEITNISNQIRRFSADDSSLQGTGGGLTITLGRYDNAPNQVPPTHQASQDSKYTRYPLLVDLQQNDKAVEITLGNFERPHMRSFHAAWISFFICFFTWFALAPLLGEVQKSLSLSQRKIWYSSVFSVAGSAFLRIIVGPLCDVFGARKCVCVIMFVASFSTMFQGLVKTATGLYVARLIAGFCGGAFVTCVYWTTTMFTKEVAGTANALAAGWGNLGGGAAQLVMGSILFPLIRWIYSSATNGTPEQNADKAWRTAIVLPGIVGICSTFLIYRYSDDTPKGNIRNMQRRGIIDEVSGSQALLSGIQNFNTWILLIQYGCSFGVETTINNLATLYFVSEFGLPTASAAAIASVFGLMNLFARGMGGFISDYSYSVRGMRGRLITHTIIFVLQGIMLLVFASAITLPGSIIGLAVFSIFVQMAEGSTYGIVPNVDTKITGSISGLVGSGGNVGGIIFSLILSVYPYRLAMKGIGVLVIASALLSTCICIRGHSHMFSGYQKRDESLNGDFSHSIRHPQDRVVCKDVVIDVSATVNQSIRKSITSYAGIFEKDSRGETLEASIDNTKNAASICSSSSSRRPAKRNKKNAFPDKSKDNNRYGITMDDSNAESSNTRKIVTLAAP